MPTGAVDDLRQALERTQALPVVFAGSGLSRRYLGTPGWDDLLDHFAELTSRPATYYRGRAGNDRPETASLIGEAFYDTWFSAEEYSESREAFGPAIENISDPLKYEVAKYIAKHEVLSVPRVQQELEALSHIRVHAIITTNWDSLLEESFPDLEVFVGQQDVLFATTQSVGEIYKIHGSVSDPRSLILTRDDYSVYWERNPYLIAKLLTMLVEHPVLFIGYGLGDSHINKMLENLIACLTEEQIEVLNDRLIFIRRAGTAEGSSLQRGTMSVGSHTLSIREYVCADYAELFTMLGSLPERFPSRLLRRLQQSVYELTFSTEPSGRVHVLPMDAEDVDDAEIVVGVGTMERLGEKGYSALGRADVCHDMLQCETDHDAERLAEGLVPNLLRGAKFVPLYYPLFLAGKLDDAGNVHDTANLPANGIALISGKTKLDPYALRDRPKRQKQSFCDLLAEGDEAVALEFGLVCMYEIEDVEALREFLIESVPKADPVPTPVAKLCCKYDHLVFGPGFKGDRKKLHRALGVSRERKRRNQ